ncbi:GTP cyclohydrolase I [Vulgatibacter incomptus]|uniref:GTP cyclohydrolase 1 n=1 Tax=Vulgatibacter incomptus TaxID=1391653 RepID=A0A0K1PCY4_9BACT|nr:GTP cyclohydrolase I [Vulgatibacter incomptus]AKU90984.1 GTP cyclohydrolase I [Vulgatibacter incomptus]
MGADRDAAPGETPRIAPPDPEKMAAGIRLFLEGCGVDLSDANVRETPHRVAKAWAEEFLDGYDRSAREVLGDFYEERKPAADEMVVVTSIDFQSMCPHHLLPYRGVAHVAYLPAGRVVGFSRLARLVDAFAHRLILQETLAREIAEAIRRELGSAGAAVVLEAEQTCMTTRGERRSQARAITEAFTGEFASRPELRERFVGRISGR